MVSLYVILENDMLILYIWKSANYGGEGGRGLESAMLDEMDLWLTP